MLVGCIELHLHLEEDRMLRVDWWVCGVEICGEVRCCFGWRVGHVQAVDRAQSRAVCGFVAVDRALPRAQKNPPNAAA